MDGAFHPSGPYWTASKADPAFPTYVRYVIDHLRECDIEELFATRFDDPTPAGRETFYREVMLLADHMFVFGRERPIAVAGANHVWPGCYSVYAFATDEFPRVALAVTRFIKRNLIPLLLHQGARRAQCASHERHLDAHRWLKHLGATAEGVYDNFGKDGSAFVVFRWLRDDVARQPME
jgi:hypothetical protein